MNLTKNFTLEEMLQSDTASRQGFKEQFNPNDEIIESLRLLCVNVLQPLRDKTDKAIIISSGYRCKRLNNAIGGASNSQHLIGEAADIKIEGITPFEVCKLIIELELPFDQIIEEFGVWTHVSFSTKNRKEKLKAYKQGRATKYKPLNL